MGGTGISVITLASGCEVRVIVALAVAPQQHSSALCQEVQTERSISLAAVKQREFELMSIEKHLLRELHLEDTAPSGMSEIAKRVIELNQSQAREKQRLLDETQATVDHLKHVRGRTDIGCVCRTVGCVSGPRSSAASHRVGKANTEAVQ
jgi:hypothetical protein